MRVVLVESPQHPLETSKQTARERRTLAVQQADVLCAETKNDSFSGDLILTSRMIAKWSSLRNPDFSFLISLIDARFEYPHQVLGLNLRNCPSQHANKSREENSLQNWPRLLSFFLAMFLRVKPACTLILMQSRDQRRTERPPLLLCFSCNCLGCTGSFNAISQELRWKTKQIFQSETVRCEAL